MADTPNDPEVKAIVTLLTVLEPLAPQARANVIDYVFRRLGIGGLSTEVSTPTVNKDTTAAETDHILPRTTDIRSLAERKNPRTASEMLATIAYYLENLAPAEERRNFIVASDISKYFKQANLPLPQNPRMALVHAKNAGYLDAQERGQYRLNAVGHNLVAHRLPAQSGEKGTARKKSITKSGTRKKRARQAKS